MKKNILVTGISSELLTKLCLKINQDEYRIFGVSRTKNKIERLEYACLLNGDLTAENFVNKIFSGNKFDMVIHGAALTHSFDAEKYFEINYRATKTIVDAVKKYQEDCIFIFISSRTAGYKSGAYGKSKILAEEYIIKNLENWLIFRPSEIFGGLKNEGINKLLNDASNKKILFCPANLKAKLYPISIDYAADLMFDDIFNKKNRNKIITIKGADGWTYIEYAKKISKEKNNKIFIMPIPKILMYILKYFLIIFRIKKIIAPDQIDRLYAEKN
ncbi:MAG TPA: sugar nucleotide-binding protein [bacterium]|nr:sugar nucleotide-binding protein [bacterium]